MGQRSASRMNSAAFDRVSITRRQGWERKKQMQGLILIDIQNDYFSGGNMVLEGMAEAASKAAQLLDRFRSRRQPIFHIQHLALQPGATFFVPETEGARIHRLVTPAPDEKVITKHFPNSFRGSDLQASLKKAGVKEIVICGAMSHMCVDSTTRAAFDLGLRCPVVEDACATRDLVHQGVTIPAAQVHGAFMAALARPFAQVTTVAELIASERQAPL